MGKNHPRPDGGDFVRGDTAAMPDRGTRTGFNGDSYGANVSPDATNRQGGMGNATKSNAPEEKAGCNNKKGH